jgi:hypothetical protein
MNEIYERIANSGQPEVVKEELKIIADALESIGYSPTQIVEELGEYM